MKTEVIKPSKPEDPNGEHGHVSVTIDGNKYETHPGVYSVSKLKELGGVQAGYALDQIVAGEIKPLPDDGKVHIRGNEVFVSHPKDSASS